MGLLLAVDEVIEARKQLRQMETVINDSLIDHEERAPIMDAYYRVWDLLTQAVEGLQKSLLPEENSVAITFLPGRSESGTKLEESGPSYRAPRRGGDPWGTLLLPAEAID